MISRRLLMPSILAVLLAISACGGGDSPEGDAADPTPGSGTDATAPSTPGEQGQPTVPTPGAGSDGLCSIIAAADLEALYPGGTPNPEPFGSADGYCEWNVTAADGSPGTVLLTEDFRSYDESLAADNTTNGVSQLDGIGDRAYFYDWYLVFEVDGVPYRLSASLSTTSGTDRAVVQDTLMRIAAAAVGALSGGRATPDGGGATPPPANADIADLCSLVTDADLAAAFPGSTVDEIYSVDNYCERYVVDSSGQRRVLMMGISAAGFDETLSFDSTDPTYVEIDGLGDRAYFSGYRTVFERNGVNYYVSTDYGTGDVQGVTGRIASLYDSLL